MELAIVGGLVVLGWRFAAKGTSLRDTQQIPRTLATQNQYPFESQVDTAALLDADKQRIREHVKRVYDPVTGQYLFDDPVPQNGQWGPTRPMLRSDKSKNTETQRRVELFTGMEDTWRHKSEKVPVFAPSDRRVAVGSGGTAKSAADLYDEKELDDRNVFGSKLNNVLPFEQQRVGPGLGVDPTVPSADGLHSRFRVLPTDQLNVHRVNQLPGRTASGGALTGFAKGARRYKGLCTNRPSLVEHAVPVTPGRAVVSATMAQPEVYLKPTRAVTCSVPNGPKINTTGGTVEARAELHVQKDGKQLPTEVIKQGPELGLLAPMETVMIHERYSNKRDNPMCGVTGTTGVTSYAPKADGCFVMKPTFRELSTPAGPGHATINSGANRVCAPSNSGFRETKARTAGEYSWLPRESKRKCFSMGQGRETQGRLMHGRLDGGVAQVCSGAVRRKVMQNAFGKPLGPGGAAHALQRADYYRRPETRRKISPCNPRTQTLGLGLFGCGGAHRSDT